jgi:hypothetical protein
MAVKLRRRGGSKFNEAAWHAILGAIRSGATYGVAAHAGGISPRTLGTWLRRGEYLDSCGSDSEHAEFYRQFAAADAAVIRRVEGNVLKASETDWRAGRFLLSVRRPDIYGDRENAHVIAQRTTDWVLDRVRTTCDQATYGRVLAAISGAVEESDDHQDIEVLSTADE